LGNLGPSIAETGFRPGVVETGSRLVAEWVFQGRVYEGEVWDETHPLEGVSMEPTIPILPQGRGLTGL